MKKFLLLITLVIMGAIVYFTVTSNVFNISKIEVSGDNKNIKEDIVKKLYKLENTSIFLLDEHKLEESILKDARVLDVSIEKKYPTKIGVLINERKPIAYIQLEKFYVIDKDLNIFAKLEEVENTDMPILMYPENDEDKKKLSSILNQLADSKIYKKTSQIRKIDDEKYELILEDGVRVYVNEDISTNKLENVYKLYAMQKNKENIEYIEARYNFVAIKPINK